MNYITVHPLASVVGVVPGAPPRKYLHCRWEAAAKFSVPHWQIAHGYHNGKRMITIGWNPLMKHEGLEADFVNAIVMQTVVTARAREFAEQWS